MLIQLGESRRRLENNMFALAFVAICCAMIESELLWSEVQQSGQLLLSTPQTTTGGSSSATAAIEFSQSFVALKCVLSTATLALVGALVLRYRTHRRHSLSMATYQLRARNTNGNLLLLLSWWLGVVCQILVETKQIGERATFYYPSTGLLMYVTQSCSELSCVCSFLV